MPTLVDVGVVEGEQGERLHVLGEGAVRLQRDLRLQVSQHSLEKGVLFDFLWRLQQFVQKLLQTHPLHTRSILQKPHCLEYP
jgi:hypothetical protein